jgi:hypothetical protein
MKTKAYLSTALCTGLLLIGAMASTYFLSSFTAEVSQEETAGIVRRLDDIGDDSEAKVVWDKVNEEVKRLAAKPVISAPSFKSAPVAVAVKEVAAPTQSAFSDIEEVDLKLADAYNSKLYKRALRSDEFNGSLMLRDGNIETLTVNLPGDLNIDLTYAQLEGNTFVYEHQGVPGRGVVFSTGQGKEQVFMVTLTGGKFEGTRLRFNHLGPAPMGNSIDAPADAPAQPDPTFEGNTSPVKAQVAQAPQAQQNTDPAPKFEDPYEQILHEDRLAQQAALAEENEVEPAEINYEEQDEQAQSRMAAVQVRQFGDENGDFELEEGMEEFEDVEMSEDELQAQAENAGFNFGSL